ncbi:MAG: AAC(3) family N-acetyltransferase [Phycisphaerae bacterium]|nr:AAC(3) family N-acetyltransferase [Phycisphaerae bacterium]
MSESIVTRADIAAGLARLGLSRGDLLFYHSSLSRFGVVDGGPDAVIDAMLDVIGPEGTLAAPGFTFSLKEDIAPVVDMRHSPSEVGVISDALRRRPGVRRSRHLTHSVCAIGPRAAELTAEHSVTPCGLRSPFAKLLAWDAKIAFLGVDQNSNTCLHAVEEEIALPRVGYREIPGARLRDETGCESDLSAIVHNSNPLYDFNPADRPLFDCGAMTVTTIGGAAARLVRGAAMRTWAIDALTRDPAFLSIRGAEWMFRPKWADEMHLF